MNQGEFMQLVLPFKDKVFRLAKRLLISTEEAEDATQEVLVKLWARNSSLDTYNNLEAFAMTMTKHFCLDQLKSKRAENLRIVHTNFENKEPRSDQLLEDNNSLDWVEKIINQLPEQQRLIIQFRDVEGYEFGEIAEIMNMNETAIRVALSRARKTVREFMIKTHGYGMG